MAAGRAIHMFTLNLSLILHPWLRVATMVVSEINDRLSPKYAPPRTMATKNGRLSPVLSDNDTANGVKATTVPTDEPMDRDMKQATINIPAGINSRGMWCSVILTVASTAPMLFANVANAPDRMKIHIMYMMLWLDAPSVNISMRLL